MYPFGLTFNSYQREGSLENKYLYNGIEKETDLDLGVSMAKYRTLDPALGRWWQIDPLGEADELLELSPYNSNINNPIRYNDPDGDCPPGKDCSSYLLGVGAAMLDNATGNGLFGLIDVRGVAANVADDPASFNTGQDHGDVGSMVTGAMEAGTGAATVEGSLVVTAASGGLAVEVTAGTALAGGFMMLHGGSTAANGKNNLENQKGRVNAEGSDLRRTKHTDNRHVDRNKYPDKSHYKKPNQKEKLENRTMAKPDRQKTQSNGRVVYEKDYKRKIGTRGETSHKVVTDPKKKKIVTSYPQKKQ